MELLADGVASGASNARLRGYVKSLVRTTWDYQQHLVHDKNALRVDAEIGLQAVSHLLTVLTAAVVRAAQKPTRCSVCDGYGLVAGVCQHCGWRDSDYKPPLADQRSDAERARALAKPHTLTSDISTLMTVDDIDAE